MLRCWPQVGSARLVFSVAFLLFVLVDAGAPAPALAVPATARTPDPSAWLAATGAHALHAAAPDNDPAAGGRELMNRGMLRSFTGLKRGGPAWLRRVSVEVDYRDGLQAAYDLVASQALLRTPAGADRLWLGERLSHDPAGQAGGDLGLHYRPDLLDQDLTLSLSGRVEDHWLQDYQRFGIDTAVRSDRFELGTSVFNDVPDSADLRGGVSDRRLDGYGVAVGARLPELSWAWIRAKRQWQMPLDSETATVSDRLSLQLGPLVPLEIETGTTGAGENRSWFAQLRFRIELGG